MPPPPVAPPLGRPAAATDAATRFLDTDQSGTISLQELREGLEKQHHRMSSEQVSRLLDTMDLDRDGQVDYGEFVAATVSSSLIIREENLLRAFELFDSDGSGFLTPEEIEAACQKYGISLDDASAQAILEGADANGDGQVDYYEFCAMMRSQEKSLLNMKGRLRSFDKSHLGSYPLDPEEAAKNKLEKQRSMERHNTQ